VKKKEKTEELNGSILNEFNFPTHPQALLDYLIFFDYFGFFLVPVDVEEVTDYLTVVEVYLFFFFQKTYLIWDYFNFLLKKIGTNRFFIDARKISKW